jgi:dTMP kinase
MALLFAADRMDHLDAEVIPNLLDGVTVISDRYDHSSVAYQSATSDRPDETIEWIRAINRYARRPDLTTVLDISPDVAARRRGSRPTQGDDMYEQQELQQRLAAFYVSIERYFSGDRIVHVDADRPVSLVAADVVRHVRILRNEEEPGVAGPRS